MDAQSCMFWAMSKDEIVEAMEAGIPEDTTTITKHQRYVFEKCLAMPSTDPELVKAAADLRYQFS